MSEEIYEKLREKISDSPLKLPKKKQILEILKEFYSEEEANVIAQHFGMPFFDRFSAKRVAKKLGKTPEEIEPALEKLVEKLNPIFSNNGFAPIRKLWNLVYSMINMDNGKVYKKPVMAAENYDWLAVGLGVCSPMGEKIPIDFEKGFQVAKQNIFNPIIFEHELSQYRSQEPLTLNKNILNEY